MTKILSNMLAGVACLTLAACGGGGGGGIDSASTTPAPTPTPTPTSLGTNVSIFANPTVATYATAGLSAIASGSGSTLAFNTLSKADADQVHIRYNSGGYYEVQMPGNDWDRLIIEKGVVPADPSLTNVFQPAAAAQNQASVGTSVSKLLGYDYSELATWSDSRSGKLGAFAFGLPTPAAQVPLNGTASYAGIVRGTTDVVGFDSFDGHYRTPVGGTVQLNFEFARGTFGGSLQLSLQGLAGSSAQIGTFTFANTIFSPRNPTYSGTFATSTAGQNYFFGEFTGPSAQETIGGWAVPFTYSGDGQVHQALGAWIAKNH